MSNRQIKRPGLLTRTRMAMSAAADAWSTGAGTPLPFNAATTGGRFRRWRPTASGPNQVLGSSVEEIVRRSRDLKRNNPMGKRAIELIAAHIVGTGIRPRSLCPDLATQKAITQLWDDWTKVSDADGTLDFYGQQRAAVEEMIVAGEVFARLRSRRMTDGLPVPLQVQLIPTEQLPISYTQMSVLNPANGVIQGIELDQIGARVSYWMLPKHPGDVDPTGSVTVTPVPVPAADVCHLFNATDRVGQLRGMPWLTAAMATLHQVDQYLDAELVRKQIAAMLVGFLLRNQDEDLTPDQVAKLGAVANTSPDDDIPDIALEPGTMNVLNPGQDVKFTEPADVGGSFEAFLRAQYQAVAAAAGVLYQELTGDWSSANDRTFRAQFNTFKRQATHWQYNLVCVQFCAPVWNRFMDYAVASGALKQPRGVSDADLRRVAWSPDRWPYINPAQDIQATGSELALGLTSRTAAISERGDDPEVIDQQIADDRKREKELGLSFSAGPDAAGASPGDELPPEPDTVQPSTPSDAASGQSGA